MFQGQLLKLIAKTILDSSDLFHSSFNLNVYFVNIFINFCNPVQFYRKGVE